MYVTSAIVCECVSQRKVLQDDTNYCVVVIQGALCLLALRMTSPTTAFSF